MPFIALIIAAAVVAIDQIIKISVVNNIKPAGTVDVIPGVFKLSYVENRGVAFGMFQDNRWIFVVLTSLMIIAIILYMFIKRPQGKLFYVLAGLIIGGGIGNLIDRILYGYVIDYLSLSFFPPVCNFADYCITAGAVMFVAVLLFQSGKKEKKPLAEGAESVDPAEEAASPTELSADENGESSADGSTDEPKEKKPDGEPDGD